MFKGILNSPLFRQYAVVFIVNLNVIGVGMSLAWPSPVLVKLNDSTDPILSRPITENDASWIVSIGYLVGAVGNFIPSLALDRIGRKYTVLLSTIPMVVASVFLTFASELWMILVSRSIIGTSVIFIFTVVPTYAAEIASKEIRGSLGTILQIMCCLGTVLMLSVGPFVSYFAINLFFTAVALASSVPLFFLPESPYFLYMTGRNNEAIKALVFLRGTEEAAKEELEEYNNTDNAENIDKWALFKNRLFLKAIVLNTIVVIAMQLVGFNSVSFYLQTILESTQTSVSPEISSVIIGLIQLVASIFTTLVTDRFARKTIFYVSLLTMMVGMCGLGTFFKVTEDAEVITGFMNYLPLISLMLVIYGYSAGPGSLFWSLASELFDSSARSVGMSVTMFACSISIFITTKYFTSVMEAVGPAATYWAFSVNCVLFCLFLRFFVPETKGKSFSEIQKALGGKVSYDEEKSYK